MFVFNTFEYEVGIAALCSQAIALAIHLTPTAGSAIWLRHIKCFPLMNLDIAFLCSLWDIQQIIILNCSNNS